MTEQATSELTPAERVKGLKFYITSHEFIEFDGNQVRWFDDQKYGVRGSMTIDRARKSLAAMMAALEAYDGKPVEATCKVVNWELELRTKFAQKAVKDAEQAAKELAEALERAKVRGR